MTLGSQSRRDQPEYEASRGEDLGEWRGRGTGKGAGGELLASLRLAIEDRCRAV